jgi:hypothetical protein
MEQLNVLCYTDPENRSQNTGNLLKLLIKKSVSLHGLVRMSSMLEGPAVGSALGSESPPSVSRSYFDLLLFVT